MLDGISKWENDHEKLLNHYQTADLIYSGFKCQQGIIGGVIEVFSVWYSAFEGCDHSTPLRGAA